MIQRLKTTNLVPLGVALQALTLFVATLFLAPDVFRSKDAVGVGGVSDSDTPSDVLTSISELPRDLQREQLPVGTLPERDKPDEPPQPKPDEGDDEVEATGESKLASLRTQTIAMSSLVPIAISAPMLGAPDSLDGLSLSDSGWLGGRSSGRRGRGGGGPSDIGSGGRGGRGLGGIGGGSGGGGYCPTPGRIGGRGGRTGGPVATGPRGRPGPGATGASGAGGSGGTPNGGRGKPANGGSGSGARGKPKN